MTGDAGPRLLLLVLGLWVLLRSISKDATGRTLIDHLLGQPGGANQQLATNSAGLTLPANAIGAGGSNPFPGSTGSRLDQGFDLTSKGFLAPARSRIVSSSQSVSGWKGGGLVAGQILSGPQAGKVWYMAEGIAPTVRQGDVVPQGYSVGVPVSNPYNGVVGNIEAGWANPASPTQPLAQVSANRPSVALSFYQWIRSLGGPAATSTSNAGYP